MIVELSESETRYPNLTPGQPYVVLGIEADDLRILNDQRRPYLYPHEIFKVVDAREPNDWVSEFDEDDERYASDWSQRPWILRGLLRGDARCGRHVLAGHESPVVGC